MELFQSHLDDGTPISFRHVEPGDKPLFVEGLSRLSPESRYRRFFRPVDRLTDDELAYLTEVDGKNHVAWIALVEREGESIGAGVGRWVRLADERNVAEAAITVIDEFHGKGIGKTLLWLLARSAIERDVRAFRAWVIGDNHPMLAILSGYGATPNAWDSGVGELTVELPETPDGLPDTPIPMILKAVATGEFPAVATGRGSGTMFSASRRATVVDHAEGCQQSAANHPP